MKSRIKYYIYSVIATVFKDINVYGQRIEMILVLGIRNCLSFL